MPRNLSALVGILARTHHRFDRVPRYEARFAEIEGAAHAMAAPLARIALLWILQSNGVRRGDRILLSPVNIPEMSAVLEFLGLEPVYVDFAPSSLFPNIAELERLATQSGAKVLFLTYIAGQLGDLAAVREICDRHGITWVQDCTQASLCSFAGRPLTRWAEFSFFSTCEFKFIHTFRGAMICVNSNERLMRLRAEREAVRAPQSSLYLLKKWASDTMVTAILGRALFPIAYPVFGNFIFSQDPLRHLERSSKPSAVPAFLNPHANDFERMRSGIPAEMLFRPSDFEATFGLRSLESLQGYVKRHREVAGIYRAALGPSGVLPGLHRDAESSYLRFPILLRAVDETESFIRRMRDQGIVVERTGLSLLGPCPVARETLRNMVFVPCHARLSEPAVRRISAVAAATIDALTSPPEAGAPECSSR